MRRAILILILLEVATFSVAAALHLGVPVFGRAESRVPPEAAVQGMVGLLLAVSAYGIWSRRVWARKAALAIHFLGVLGALFGVAVALMENVPTRLDLYDLMRLTILILVPILLSTPAAKKELSRDAEAPTGPARSSAVER